MSEAEPLDAGVFSEWRRGMERALAGERESDVPCGDCTACCRSSQFVHIEPDETETLASIPAALLFPAPRMPKGHQLLGYDERGRCPMLVDDRCSIYATRPRTCRTYDCRVFAAAGVEITDPAQAAIGQRARRWRFDFPLAADRVEHDSVRAAATYLDQHEAELPPGTVPANATRRAVLALRLHDSFLDRDDSNTPVSVMDPDPDAIRAVLQSRS